MAEKTPNIVEKVFDRARRDSERISPLFTHFKPAAKIAPASEKMKSPLFRKLSMAVDFGASSVKLVQFAENQKDNAFELAAADEEAYETSSSRDQASKQTDALQKILRRHADLGLNATACLSSKDVQVFNFAFPPMSPGELETAVDWKLKQLKPFNLEHEKIQWRIVYWENQVRNSTVSNNPQRVTVVCASSDAVSKKVQLLSQAGLKTVVVEPAPVALASLRKLKVLPTSSAEEVVVWLDLGAEESTLIVEKGGSVYFLRNLSITALQFTRQLAQSLGVSEAEAESLKKLYGLSFWSKDMKADSPAGKGQPDSKSAEVYRALASLLENLVIDIEHSFKYFSYQVSQSQINSFSRLVLAGGGAGLKNLDVFLSDRLGVPVETVRPFAGVKISASLAGQQNLAAERSFSLGAAAGLAFSELLPKSQRMNLLPKEEVKTVYHYVKILKKQPRLAAAVAAAVAVLLLGPQLIRIGYAKAETDKYEKQVKASRADLGQMQINETKLAETQTKLLEKRKQLENELAILKESNQDRKRMTDVLSSLAALLPEEIWVTKLNYAEKKMTMVGLTLNNELVVNFIDALKQSDNFKDVTFNYSQKETKSSVYRFEVTMMVG